MAGEEAEAGVNLATLKANAQTPLNCTDGRNVTSTTDVHGGERSFNIHLWPAGEMNFTEPQLARQRIKALMKIRLLLLIRNLPRFIFQACTVCS